VKQRGQAGRHQQSSRQQPKTSSYCLKGPQTVLQHGACAHRCGLVRLLLLCHSGGAATEQCLLPLARSGQHQCNQDRANGNQGLLEPVSAH
jgi:hypothetical protein